MLSSKTIGFDEKTLGFDENPRVFHQNLWFYNENQGFSMGKPLNSSLENHFFKWKPIVFSS